jgi:hypothetical protein
MIDETDSCDPRSTQATRWGSRGWMLFLLVTALAIGVAIPYLSLAEFTLPVLIAAVFLVFDHLVTARVRRSPRCMDAPQKPDSNNQNATPAPVAFDPDF